MTTLILDDDPARLAAWAIATCRAERSCHLAATAAEARRALSNDRFDRFLLPVSGKLDSVGELLLLALSRNPHCTIIDVVRTHPPEMPGLGAAPADALADPLEEAAALARGLPAGTVMPRPPEPRWKPLGTSVPATGRKVAEGAIRWRAFRRIGPVTAERDTATPVEAEAAPAPAARAAEPAAPRADRPDLADRLAVRSRSAAEAARSGTRALPARAEPMVQI